MASRHKSEMSGNTKQSWLVNFESIRPLLHQIIGRIVKPDDIEDIVQETFVKSFAAARKTQILNPKAFMLKTAKNLALNNVSRADRRLNKSLEDLEDAEEENFLKIGGADEDAYQSKEMFIAFCRSVAELPVICRRVFILKKVYGYNQKEISKFLNISESTVEKHVAKGLAKTTMYLISNGYLPEIKKGC